jgi:hypothetical protein
MHWPDSRPTPLPLRRHDPGASGAGAGGPLRRAGPVWEVGSFCANERGINSWRPDLFMLRAAAEIARAGGICHESSSGTLRLHAGSRADAGVAD